MASFEPRLSWLVAGALMSVPGAAAADVVAASEAGLEVRETATIAAPPARVWATLVTPARWWDKAHTWGGDAGALSLDARPGGCFCERLSGGGGVEHLRVVYVAPGKLLRMTGGLGPFQGDAVAGVMTVELRGEGAGTVVVLSYSVAGRRTGGFAALAPGVDGVLAGQVARLKVAAAGR